MSEENKLSNVQQIIQHTINKEPSQIKSIVNKEIASRVMTRIEAKKSDIGSSMFGN